METALDISRGAARGRRAASRLSEAFGFQIGQTLNFAVNTIDPHPIARQQMISATTVNDTYANQFDPAFRQMYMNLLKLKDAEAQF